MGAGCKSNLTRVCVGDISASIGDPLSRATRRRLKILGVKEGIPVIFSTEKPGPGKAALLPLSEEEFAKGEVGDLSVLPDFRVRSNSPAELNGIGGDQCPTYPNSAHTMINGGESTDLPSPNHYS